MEAIDRDILLRMVDKDYVIFAPRGERDLRREYPELYDYPELTKLNPSELLFVWWYSCQSSPIYDLPEEKRFPIAIDRSFKGSQREERKSKYASTAQAPALPSDLKAACKTMNAFNPGMRIQMALDNMHLLRQCQLAIRQNIPLEDPEAVEKFMKTAALSRKIMGEIAKDIERGNHGVDEVQNTTLANLEGLAEAYHKAKQ
jgi:hypothetical protein